MQTYHPKNIKVGIIEFMWCPSKKAWAIHGRQYETSERKARELARKMNNAVSGKNKIERHI
ncbi:MAG: hypothetical protein R3309_12845 [Reinekea sp.]|nr:hypothetical protein [Reinekea sp.]